MESDVPSTNETISEHVVAEEAQRRLIEVEQVSRYLWAAQAARDRLVLDAGCGNGYGSRLLASAGAREVIGVDQARAVLDLAAIETPEPVRFLDGDLRKLKFEDDKFELVVCFEVIEYLEDPLTVLDELVRVLAPRGLLLVSSPNRGAYQPGNPYHLNAFTPAQLQGALAARLSHVQLLLQRDYVVSALRSGVADDQREGVSDDVVLHRLAADSPGEAPYTVAMASDTELATPRGFVALGRTIALRDWLSESEMHAATIAKKDDQIDGLRTRLQERDRLTKLLEGAERRAAEVPELKLRMADLEVEVEAARKAAEAARREADQLDRMLIYGRRMLRFVRPLIKPLRRLRHKLRG